MDAVAERPSRAALSLLSLVGGFLLLAAPSASGTSAGRDAACRVGDDGPEAEASRAIWVWEEDSFRLLDSARARGEFRRFLERRCVSTVYLYADRYMGRDPIEEEPERYRSLVRFLHRHDFEVYALLGSAHLATQEYVLPGRRAEAEAMLRSVLVYNRSASESERFDGVNVDVEPYLLDAWDEDREAIARRYLALSEAFMAMKREHGFEGPIGPAIPFWFDGVEVTRAETRKPLSEHVLDVYDYVAIMAYRDRAEGRDGIVRHVLDELEYAGARGKRVRVGVETKEGDLDKVTFHEEGLHEMESQLRIVADELERFPAFGGLVIHHYGSYRRLSTNGDGARAP